jgi:excinuclease ABC subunit C
LDYHIGRCKAPCVDFQSAADYRAMIDEILQVLAGDTEVIRGDAEKRMRSAAATLDFEGAAKLRDVLHGLDVLAGEQRVQKFTGTDTDVVGLARDGDLAVAAVLEFRRGRMIGRKTQRLTGIHDEDDTTLWKRSRPAITWGAESREFVSCRVRSSSRRVFPTSRFWSRC